jgi:hypothetical protein
MIHIVGFVEFIRCYRVEKSRAGLSIAAMRATEGMDESILKAAGLTGNICFQPDRVGCQIHPALPNCCAYENNSSTAIVQPGTAGSASAVSPL